jgi:hypothetical protein
MQALDVPLRFFLVFGGYHSVIPLGASFTIFGFLLNSTSHRPFIPVKPLQPWALPYMELKKKPFFLGVERPSKFLR